MIGSLDGKKLSVVSAKPQAVYYQAQFDLHLRPFQGRMGFTYLFRRCRCAPPHRHQVKRKSKRLKSLSNSNVPGLERLFRWHVFVTTAHKSASTCSNFRRKSRLDAKRPTKLSIALQTLCKLFLGLPQTLPTNNQCRTNAASSLAIWRTVVEPFMIATRSCDFHRLKSNSTCQRSR